jgi:uncharacterized integral membrane protein
MYDTENTFRKELNVIIYYFLGAIVALQLIIILLLIVIAIVFKTIEVELLTFQLRTTPLIKAFQAKLDKEAAKKRRWYLLGFRA